MLFFTEKAEAARCRTDSAQNRGGFGSKTKYLQVKHFRVILLTWKTLRVLMNIDEFSFSVILYDFYSHQELPWALKRLNPDDILSLSISWCLGGEEGILITTKFFGLQVTFSPLPRLRHQNHSGGREDVEICCLILLRQQLLLQEGLWCIRPCSLLKNYGKRLKCLAGV